MTGDRMTDRLWQRLAAKLVPDSTLYLLGADETARWMRYLRTGAELEAELTKIHARAARQFAIQIDAELMRDFEGRA